MSDRTGATIRYRELWDVPRIFLAQYQGQTFLFDCQFDEATEDFPDTYKVYSMADIPDADLPKDWDLLLERVTAYFGEVLVKDVFSSIPPGAPPSTAA